MDYREFEEKYPILGQSISNAESIVRGVGDFLGGAAGELESLGRKGINALGEAVQKTGLANEKPKQLVSEKTAFRTIDEFKAAYPERFTTPTPQAEGMRTLGAGLAGIAGFKAPTAVKATKGMPVGLSIQDAGLPTKTMAEALAGEDYTLKTLERVPQNKGMLPVQTIREQMRRPDVSKSEKDLLEQILPMEGVVNPADVVKQFKDASKNYRTKPVHNDTYSDYGIQNLDRKNPQFLRPGTENLLDEGDTPVRTTVHSFDPEVSGNKGNHFNDPNYFGHTRAFEEDGIPHVVEVQSDLMQHKALKPEERATLEPEYKKLRGELLATRENNARLDREIEEVRREQNKLMLGKIDGGEDDYQRLRDKLNELRAQKKTVQDLAIRVDEMRTKLNAGVTKQDVTPMKKNHQQRLVREELAMAEQAGKDRVRFASPDTVAKVEMWPDQVRILQEAKDRLRRAEEVSRDIAKQLEAEGVKDSHWLRAADDSVILARNELARIESRAGGPRFKKEHQGIYDNYKELEKYLKSIGGTPHTDKYGHTWIEVPTKGAQSPVKDGRTPMFAAAPFAMGSASQYNNTKPEGPSK